MLIVIITTIIIIIIIFRSSSSWIILYVSGKLPTYPSPKPTFTLTSHLVQNVSLGEG